MSEAAATSYAREPAALRPALVQEVSDGDAPLGMLVIDRLIAGRACGGLRIAPAITLGELEDLAEAMTLKFAFLGIACGGAKAALLLPSGALPGERRRRTRAFGAAIAGLLRDGRYVVGTDMGCGDGDLWEVRDAAGLVAGARPPAPPAVPSTTARCSGQSAAIAALAALAARGRAVRGATLAVLGYGRVGAALATRFTAAGGRLVAASTAAGAVIDPAGLDVTRLDALRAVHGDAAPLHHPGARRTPPEDLVALPVDVLAPCATTHVVDATNWRRLRCRVVAPGANAAVTAEAEAYLGRAGVTVLPDFVANAGGVLVAHFWPLRLPAATVHRLLEEHFRAMVERLLARATPALPAAAVARGQALRNLERMLRRGPAAALRHERWIARVAGSRFGRRLPPALITRLVLRMARDLERGPDLSPSF